MCCVIELFPMHTVWSNRKDEKYMLSPKYWFKYSVWRLNIDSDSKLFVVFNMHFIIITIIWFIAHIKREESPAKTVLSQAKFSIAYWARSKILQICPHHTVAGKLLLSLLHKVTCSHSSIHEFRRRIFSSRQQSNLDFVTYTFVVKTVSREWLQPNDVFEMISTISTVRTQASSLSNSLKKANALLGVLV